MHTLRSWPGSAADTDCNAAAKVDSNSASSSGEHVSCTDNQLCARAKSGWRL